MDIQTVSSGRNIDGAVGIAVLLLLSVAVIAGQTHYGVHGHMVNGDDDNYPESRGLALAVATEQRQEVSESVNRLEQSSSGNDVSPDRRPGKDSDDSPTRQLDAQ